MTKPIGGDGPTKKGGRPRGPSFEITHEMRDSVARLAAVGTRQEVIARILKISVDTLDRHFRAELDTGVEDANAQVAGALFSRALAGELGAIVWWEKTRAGQRDISRHEMSGPDGGPIEYRNLTDEEVDARIAALLGSGSTGEAAD